MRTGENKKIRAGAREKLPAWFSAAWSTRAVALALNMAIMGYSSLYFTDVLGLNPITIGTILMLSKVMDAFTDLAIGYLVDNTKTRLGKARPYEFAIVFLWIAIFAMYSTPKMGTIATYIWVFITYTLQSAVFITMLYGTDGVYLVRSVRTEKNRIKVTANVGVYQMVICTIVGMIVPQVMAKIGVDRHSWSLVALCFAIPCAVIGMGRFLFIPELSDKELAANSEEELMSLTDEDKKINKHGNTETTGKKEKIGFKQAFGTLKQNKYIWIYALMYFCYHFANGISGGGQNYYLKYVVGDLGAGTWLGMAALVSLPLLIFAPKIMNKLGTRKALIGGLFMMLAGPIIRLIGGTNMATLIGGTILFVAGSVPIAFMLNVYLFECMDYGEYKTGIRIEGMMGSITSFVAKIASAVATWIIGVILSMAGYVGTAETIAPSAIVGIKAIFNVVPIAIVIVALVLSCKYDVEKQLPEIRKILNDKKK